jgi:hypothetical protein
MPLTPDKEGRACLGGRFGGAVPFETPSVKPRPFKSVHRLKRLPGGRQALPGGAAGRELMRGAHGLIGPVA